MAGVVKVHGFATPDQFFGRTIVGITISTLVAAPALVDGNRVRWPALEAALQAIETISTVSVVGAWTATDTDLNMIIEGVDAVGDKYRSAGQDTLDMTIFEKLAELTGETVVQFVI